ncbi:MAG: dicarboxylate transporter, dctp subunit [Clostridiales bacterium]|jgi:tripartite ATP-independent transporter DctP family solute receptor|nr:dicarboxylate transporter, dctp subunit [Clostridiales bacterium]
MKKTFVFAVTIIMSFSLVFSGCESKKTSLSAGDSDIKKVVILKAATNSAEESGHVTGLKKFKELVEKNTDGRVKVEVYSNGVLGDEEQLAEALKMGSLQVMVGAAAKYANFVPEMDITSTPYTFKNWDHFKAVFEGDVAEKLAQFTKERRGDTLLGFMTDGARSVFTRKEYKSFDEMKGIKFRIQTGPVESAAWNALGVHPVPSTYTELYSALQSGAVEGAENTLMAVKTMKFSESCKYIYKTEHNFFTLVLLISQKGLEMVPAEYRDVVVNAGKEAAKWEVENSIQKEAEVEKELQEKYGVKINKMTKEQKEDAIKKMTEVQDQIARKLKLEGLLKDIRNLAVKY